MAGRSAEQHPTETVGDLVQLLLGLLCMARSLGTCTYPGLEVPM
jgi:hypothetical protein